VIKADATGDLHIFHGKIPDMESGDILGHEFMGIVEEAGKGVMRLKKGDRVVVPFTIACGQCFFCNKTLFAACETTNPGRGAILNRKNVRSGAGLFGYSHLYGGYPGGQAEYVRVPKANVGPLVIPPGLADEQVLFLSDILPTGYQAAVNGEVGPGSTVAIFGAGPVGLMAAASARLLGAERIFMVDEHAYRLEFALATYSVEPINFKDIDDPAGAIIERTDFRGADASIDAVGFEAKGSTLETVMADLKLEGSSGKALACNGRWFRRMRAMWWMASPGEREGDRPPRVSTQQAMQAASAPRPKLWPRCVSGYVFPSGPTRARSRSVHPAPLRRAQLRGRSPD
jgi:threonine dehydrogenase-like Zn-dependent dehydrogenase